MGPGTAVWERFGHNAIRVTDARTGADTTYNYGMFDFAAERFFIRFAQGRMLYWTEGHRADREIAAYVRADRSVWIQELELTPAQRVALRDFLEWNSREENKYYGYDYYRDNCSTRVRDAIDRILGGVIEAQTASVPTGTTWRSHTRRLTSNDAIVYTGLNTGPRPRHRPPHHRVGGDVPAARAARSPAQHHRARARGRHPPARPLPRPPSSSARRRSRPASRRSGGPDISRSAR